LRRAIARAVDAAVVRSWGMYVTPPSAAASAAFWIFCAWTYQFAVSTDVAASARNEEANRIAVKIAT
jgi:hypothetical protein